MAQYANDYFAIPALGNYKLGFFAGSYDRTGGTWLGATLQVKSFQMTVPMMASAKMTEAVMEASTKAHNASATYDLSPSDEEPGAAYARASSEAAAAEVEARANEKKDRLSNEDGASVKWTSKGPESPAK